jgi:hypothetical protein
MKLLCLLLASVIGCAAQSTTRAVVLNWALSTSTQVTGYTVSTAPAASGPWTQIGCTGTVTGSTCSGTSATSTFADPAETIGNTVYYELIAVAPACTAGQTTPCGNSNPTTASLLIPARPAQVILTLIPQ